MNEEQNYWRDVFKTRVSRRGLLGGAALAAAGALGCRIPEQARLGRPTATPAAPKSGGTFRVAIDVDAPDLDMHTQLSYATSTPMGAIYDPLVRWAAGRNPDGSVQAGKFYPWIAESWEMPDDTTYVFKIRNGVKFHNLPPVNGRELTAEDVKYSIERIRTPRNEFARASMFQPVQFIEVVDKYTVKFRLYEPFAPFLINLADGWNVMVAKEVVEKDGDLKTTAVGTGPFYLNKRNRGFSFEFKRNPEFFIKGTPYFQAFKILIIRDQGTRLASFRTGELDLQTGLTFAELESLKTSVRNLQSAVSYTGHSWIFMNTKVPPFNNKNLRKALVHATNVQDYIDMLWDGKGKQNGPIQFFLKPWALPESELPKFDLDLAKQYMAQSAYPRGVKVVCDTTETLRSAEIMQIAQHQWKEIGVELELNMLDWGAYMRKVAVQKDYFVSAVSDWTYVDPNEWLYTYFHTRGTNNRTNYSNLEYDRLVEEQRRTLDEKKRVDMVYRLQKMLLEDAHHIDLASWESYTAWRPEVKGYEAYVMPAGGTYGFLLHDVWLDE